jgi:Zn finger protein HypA/HybF involved in hydrogenase expression
VMNVGKRKMKVKVKVRCKQCKFEYELEAEDPSATIRFQYCPKCLTGGTFRGGPLQIIEVIKDETKK